MRIILAVTLALFTLPALAGDIARKEQGNLVMEGVPEIPDRVKDRLVQYSNVRACGFKGFDTTRGGMLITTRFGETSQVHYVAMPGGAREQLTFFEEPVRFAAMNPSASRHSFLFTKDVGGSEFYQVFHFDLKTGAHKMLTDGKSRYGSVLWSKQGDRFAYYSTERNGKDWDIFVMDPNNPKSKKRVVTKTGTWYPRDWSENGKKLLVGKLVSVAESYIYEVTIRNGKLKQINPSKSSISYAAAAYSKDGKGVYLASDEGSEFQRLRYYDLRKKKQTVLTPDINWDVKDVEVSPDGNTVAFTVNEGGVDSLYFLDTKTNKYRKATTPLGTIYNLEFGPNNTIGAVFNTPQTPGDVHTLDYGSGDKVTRWTYSEVGGLDSSKFVVPKLVEYETFDKKKIPAFVYKPKTKGPHPVLISIHGGPEGQYVPYFSSSVQYYVNEMNLAVIAPNVRGSQGYGKTYLTLDNGFKREESVKDIGALLDWIETQPDLDKKRVAVIGGSYGGYMVLASMVHYSDRLRAGVDFVGISNFVTFLKNTQDYRRDLRRVEYGDERDPKMREHLEKISPTNNATKITKPLFVIQGKNDPRVPVTEAEQMVAVVRENGGTVWYLMAKDEGHGFGKKSNRDVYRQAVVLFLEKHLLSKESARK